MTHPAIHDDAVARLGGRVPGLPGAGAGAAQDGGGGSPRPTSRLGAGVRQAAHRALDPMVARLGDQAVAALRPELDALRAEVASLRAELTRTRADLEAELVVAHAELAARRADGGA